MIIEVTFIDAFTIGIAFAIGSFIGSVIWGMAEGILKGLGWIK